MVYSPPKRQMIMFGGAYDQGNGRFNDTWSYDPNFDSWALPPTSGIAPAARASQAMAYDSADDQVIMFGGSGDTEELNDTWDYTP